jgi:hypothetical protein
MVGGLLDVNGMPVGEGVPATSVTRFTTLEYVLNLRFFFGLRMSAFGKSGHHIRSGRK